VQFNNQELTMQYRTDLKSGKKLSVLGFGCMRFPMDKNKTEKLIIKAVEEGINYFDTAYVYGNSEVILGELLEKNGLREKIYIATKIPHSKCKSYEDFDKIFDEQLSRLRTDYIDYYLIHNIANLKMWTRLCGIGIEKWIADKKAKGKISQIGFSFHGAQNEFMSLIDAYDWDFTQIQYNYMDEHYQAGRAGLNKAYEKGIPVIIMEPLLGGKLATELPPKAAKHFKEVNPDRTPAGWALMWLWNQPGVTVVLSGMSADQQLEDNLKSAENAKPDMLTERETAVFKPVMDAIRESYKVPCTSCNYCMPCPHGVNIPGCFSALNTRYAMGLIPGLTQYVTGTAANNPKQHARAKFCVACGACEKECPQHIKIPEMLKEVDKRIETPFFKVGLWIIQKLVP